MTRSATDEPRDVFHSDCPARIVLEHVTSRWGTLVLCSLGQDSPQRFYVLRDRIDGISEKMLSQNLHTLVRDGLVERTVQPSRPPSVSYGLTPLGVQLAKHLRPLVHWITDHATEILSAQEHHDAQS